MMSRNAIYVLFLALFLTACSGLRITSYQNPVSSTRPYKLSSAGVQWINNEKLRVSVTKHYPKYAAMNSKITPGDLASAKKMIDDILIPFRETLPAKLAEQLESNGIPPGNENTFEITPVFMNYECTASEAGKPCQGGIIREFKLGINLKNNDTGKLLFSTGTETFITKTKPESYDAIIAEHASSIIKALMNQHWLCSPEEIRYNQCALNPPPSK
jgi:hypothetical protein